ncbi:MAG: hypothetical protein FWH57_03080 [Oscillospiraceae bacterium]|nr:hypothetical protein [Oscillospiraceae bacterium]
MKQKIRNFPLAAYLAITGMFKEFKRDERGISGTVVAILLILVGVLLVVVIWGFLDGWLKEIWDKITSNADKIEVK